MVNSDELKTERGVCDKITDHKCIIEHSNEAPLTSVSSCNGGHLLLVLQHGYLPTINKLLSFHQRLHVMDDERLEDC